MGLHEISTSISCEIVGQNFVRGVISEAHVLENDEIRSYSVVCERRNSLQEGFFDKLRHALIRACLSPNFIQHTVLSMTIVPQVDLHSKSKTLPIYCRFTARLLPSSSGGSNSSRSYGLSRGYSRIGSCSTCGQPLPASIMGRRLMSMMYRRSCTMLSYAVIFCCAFT